MAVHNQSQYWQSNEVHLKDPTEFLHRMIWLRDFEVIVGEILMVEIIKLMSQLKNAQTLYFPGLTSC